MTRTLFRNHRFTMLSLCSLLFLGACNLSSPLELIYYNRTKVSFIDEEGEDKTIYLCAKEKTAEQTQQKAEKANQMYQSEMALLIETLSQEMMKEIEQKSGDKEQDNSILDGISMSMRLTKDAEKIVEKIESKYQCILIDIVENKTQ